MIETKKKSIDGDEYAVTQFPARRGLNLKIRLVKVLGPALAEAAGALNLSAGAAALEQAGINPWFLGQAVSRLVEGLDSSTGELVLELLSQTRKNNRELNEAAFDLEFAGKYLTLYKVLGFVIQVNGFFGQGGIGTMAAALNPMANRKDQTPETEDS